MFGHDSNVGALGESDQTENMGVENRSRLKKRIKLEVVLRTPYFNRCLEGVFSHIQFKFKPYFFHDLLKH